MLRTVVTQFQQALDETSPATTATIATATTTATSATSATITATTAATASPSPRPPPRLLARRHLFVAVSLLDAATAAIERGEGPSEGEVDGRVEGRAEGEGGVVRLREQALRHLRRAVECDESWHMARMELCLVLEEARDLAGRSYWVGRVVFWRRGIWGWRGGAERGLSRE